MKNLIETYIDLANVAYTLGLYSLAAYWVARAKEVSRDDI